MLRKLCLSFVLLLSTVVCRSGAKEVIPLHVDGRYFKDPAGNVVNLHGFGQTYSPWFNEEGKRWSNYDVDACLKYNQGLIDKIIAADFKMDFVRLHMDPYWSNTPGVQTTGESDIHAFDFNRFKKYLAEVFIPMVKYISGKGMYVVMRPPGVCPEYISLNDAYQKYLLKVWNYVSQQPELKDNPAVMYELANEPIKFTVTQGKSESEEMTAYMQAIVDIIRQHCDNIILVPGLGYQASYSGFFECPIQGKNIGFAVHCYPGFFNGAHDSSTEVLIDYEKFRNGWRNQVGPASMIAPIMVTEMDWAPAKYKSSWGKAFTGTVGDNGFGANFKQITDDDGNVSWMLFTSPDILARYDNVPASASNTTILNDPEACVWPVWHWFQDYAKTYYPSYEKYEQTLVNPYKRQTSDFFPLTKEGFNPNIWESGSFDETTGTLVTGAYGFGGWEYPLSVDFSGYKYLVVELNSVQNCNASFRIFDRSGYFTKAAMYDFGNKTRLVVDLQNMKRDGSSDLLITSHIYRVGIWSYGGKPISIKKVYLSNDGTTEAPTGIEKVTSADTYNNKVYNLKGQVVGNSSDAKSLPKGIYIMNHRKFIVK